MGNSISQEDMKAVKLLSECKTGNLQSVKKLLTQVNDIHTRSDILGRTPLTCATEMTNHEMIEHLVEAEVDVNLGVQGPGTPLFIACVAGNKALAQYFLENKANPNIGSFDGRTALFACVEHDRMELAKMLLTFSKERNDVGEKSAYEVDVDKSTDAGMSPFLMACCKGKSEMIQLLMDNGANVLAHTATGVTALHFAAAHGDLELVQTLVSKGLAVDVRDFSEFTPLAVAAEHGKVEVVKWLIEQGADPLATGWNGNGALHLAAHGNHLNVVEYLTGLGKDVGANLLNFYLKNPRNLHFEMVPGNRDNYIIDHVSLGSIFRPGGSKPPTPTPATHDNSPADHVTLGGVFGNRTGGSSTTPPPSAPSATKESAGGKATLNEMLAQAGGEQSHSLRIITAKKIIKDFGEMNPSLDSKNVNFLSPDFIKESESFYSYEECLKQNAFVDVDSITSGASVLLVCQRWDGESDIDPSQAKHHMLVNYLKYHHNLEHFDFDYIWLEYSCMPSIKDTRTASPGDQVEVLFDGKEWKEGTVLNVKEGCMDIEFPDGEEVMEVPSSDVRRWFKERQVGLLNMATVMASSSACLVLTDVVELPLFKPPKMLTAEVTDLVATAQDPMVVAQVLAALLHGRTKVVVSFRCGHHDHFEAFPKLEGKSSTVGLEEVLAGAFHEAECDQEIALAAVIPGATYKRSDSIKRKSLTPVPREEQKVIVESVFSIFNKSAVKSVWHAVTPFSTLTHMVRLGKRANDPDYKDVVKKAFELSLSEEDVTSDHTPILKGLWLSLDFPIVKRKLDAINFMTMATAFLSKPWVDQIQQHSVAESNSQVPALSRGKSTGFHASERQNDGMAVAGNEEKLPPNTDSTGCKCTVM